jgi:hypothetical protein
LKIGPLQRIISVFFLSIFVKDVFKIFKSFISLSKITFIKRAGKEIKDNVGENY